ncbi:Serine/threonine protein kinase [Nonomuraea maritima]|uniref:non-specific serine/threonine protein kinase n=1 Tax=Nonomuraea maritima TaxID=683260 RepID=A0A1G9SAT7_9ACTN|nr:serine/threonine-protein kinase [Nonomuraea maritima]SDM32502.1 Serine/threonine protein kinase [Nonomuraea maritima]
MQGELYLLAGRYRLIESLGQGGAGTVWRAIDEILDRQVAVKQVRVPPGLTPRERATFTERAIHEARAAGRLRDPAIVLVHDIVIEGGQPWIIMDIVTGRSLDKEIKERGPLPPAYVAAIGLRVLSALGTAHAHGMVHQDVKPGNVLLDSDGVAMLSDFGIAAPMGQGDRFSTAGSLGYMAPERLNEQPSGPASDLWSLGATLYTAVEGRAPFERELPAAVAAAVLLHEPPFPSRAGRELGGLLMAMLAKDPAVRPTAAQVGQVLTRVADASTGHHALPAAPRRRWLLPAVLAAVVVLGGGGWYAATALGQTKETGRFAAAPAACGLLDAAEVARLVDGTPKASATRPGECQWIMSRRMRAADRLIVRVWAEQPTRELSGPQVAERRFASERTTRAAGEGQGMDGAREAVRDVSGVGEASIIQNSFETYAVPGESVKSDSTLLFRTSNLLGEVVWHREEVPNGAPADEKTVVDAARRIVAGLAK